MDKGIGFNRNIRLEWLEATAAFRTQTDDGTEIRSRLEPLIGQHIRDRENVRKSIDILQNIWLKSAEDYPDLHGWALNHYRETAVVEDRRWLHYGLTLLAYPFFYTVVSVVGTLGRYEENFTPSDIKRRVFAELGEIGSVNKAVERVLYSLRDWEITAETDRRYVYAPKFSSLMASNQQLEAWLLACGLHAHPAQELPFPDLLNMPALFPFCFTITAHSLRQSGRFDVQRQGLGLEMVKVV